LPTRRGNAEKERTAILLFTGRGRIGLGVAVVHISNEGGRGGGWNGERRGCERYVRGMREGVGGNGGSKGRRDRQRVGV